MLPHKFTVFLIREISKIDKKVPCFCRYLSKKICPTEKSSCKLPKEKIGGRIIRNRCMEYKKSLEKCPKKSFDELCCKKLFEKALPKCENTTSSDDYRKAHVSIKIRANKIMNYVEESVKAIRKELEEELKVARNEETSKMHNILQSVEYKAVRLSEMDPHCGMSKKNDILMLNDKAKRELNVWQCDSAPGIRKIKSDLSKLEQDAKFKGETAMALIQCCRNCRSPLALKECIKKNAEEAMKIIEAANTEARKRLNVIRELKNTTFKENRAAASEITKWYEKEMRDMSNHLSDCIEGIIKARRTNKSRPS
ncbi:uncharacterized protein LOC112494105 [Cephus cinctus]|uniref:Uncharacterized protein LOC112494105 n=1 Tax=Cephus cinctus TaxID=211228 RepID=A0AAJ7RDT0_CEPCN|nr:uncharacterized protein LOC112494105 [Cephus cinctus]